MSVVKNISKNLQKLRLMKKYTYRSKTFWLHENDNILILLFLL